MVRVARAITLRDAPSWPEISSSATTTERKKKLDGNLSSVKSLPRHQTPEGKTTKRTWSSSGRTVLVSFTRCSRWSYDPNKVSTRGRPDAFVIVRHRLFTVTSHDRDGGKEGSVVSLASLVSQPARSKATARRRRRLNFTRRPFSSSKSPRRSLVPLGGCCTIASIRAFRVSTQHRVFHRSSSHVICRGRGCISVNGCTTCPRYYRSPAQPLPPPRPRMCESRQELMDPHTTWLANYRARLAWKMFTSIA